MDDQTRAAKLEKIRKLFAQAADVAGTPEADAFNTRAFDLLARHGIDEAEARRHTHTGPAEIRLIEITPTGAYITQQTDLLTTLAKALHCYTLKISRQHHPLRVLIWGIEQHVTRVRLLWSMLMPQMLAGARRTRPEPGSRTGVKVHRRSWMDGYTRVIAERLTTAERCAAQQSAAPGMELELVSDHERARQAGREWLADNGLTMRSPRPSHRQHSWDASERGRAAGARANLGQTGLATRRALER